MSQFCPHCGQRIDFSAQPGGVPPTGGMPPPGGMGPEGEPTPWERRGTLGLVQGYLETWKAVMLNPERFWSSTSPQGSMWDAMSFAWIAFAISSVLSLPLLFLQNPERLRGMLERLNAPPEVTQMLSQLVGGSSQFISWGIELVLYPLFLLIGAGIIHLLGLIFGVSKNGFGATVRVVGYAAAPTIFTWVPCLGPIVASIYAIVLTVWGLARLHRSSVGKAAAAVLTPIVLMFCCCCGSSILSALTLAGRR